MSTAKKMLSVLCFLGQTLKPPTKCELDSVGSGMQMWFERECTVCLLRAGCKQVFQVVEFQYEWVDSTDCSVQIILHQTDC